MANPFFSALGGRLNPAAIMSQLRQNPLGLLKQYGFNVPENINSPEAIIQHLMNSGQISQAQFDRARQMAQTFRF